MNQGLSSATEPHTSWNARLRLVANDKGTDLHAELRISLAVRHAYTHFRRGMERAGRESPGDVQAALASAATGITNLIAKDVYGDLRMQDRVQLRSLEERLAEWHRGPADRESGSRLWQEVQDVAHLFASVNHRPELCGHDLEILTTAREQLRRSTPFSPVPLALRESLAGVFGRDDDLDTLVLQPGPVLARNLLKHLEAIVRRLDPARAGRSVQLAAVGDDDLLARRAAR